MFEKTILIFFNTSNFCFRDIFCIFVLVIKNFMFNLKINKMDKKELSKLTDSELITLSTKTAIEVIKASRDGKPIPDGAKAINAESKRRGLKLELTTNFIRRVLDGKFD